MKPSIAHFALLVSLAPAALAEKFATLSLQVAPPPLAEIAFDAEIADERQGLWSGKLGERTVEVLVRAIPSKELDFFEPEDVSELLRTILRDRDEWRLEEWDAREVLTGAFGSSPIAALAHGGLRDQGKVAATLLILAGLTPQHGYTIEVYVDPPADDAALTTLKDWLRKAVTYDGAKRDPRWTDEEARARWTAVAPEATHKKLDPPLRTEHFLILTCSSGGKAFAKKMEENYVAIRKLYPFQEVAGRRLMPVFLFRTPDEYYEFLTKSVGFKQEEAEATKGLAYLDWYATWYEAPNDPVHIHEATHQIFRNRMFLGGGGSWFQEGVAEYIETKDNERNDAARAVKLGRHVPLREFVKLPSLIAGREGEDVSGGDEASDNYKQAAVLIEFLHKSKWSAPKFTALVQGLGLAPDNDVEAIERVVQKVLGTDLKGLEERWIEYCKKR